MWAMQCCMAVWPELLCKQLETKQILGLTNPKNKKNPLQHQEIHTQTRCKACTHIWRNTPLPLNMSMNKWMCPTCIQQGAHLHPPQAKEINSVLAVLASSAWLGGEGSITRYKHLGFQLLWFCLRLRPNWHTWLHNTKNPLSASFFLSA